MAAENSRKPAGPVLIAGNKSSRGGVFPFPAPIHPFPANLRCSLIPSGVCSIKAKLKLHFTFFQCAKTVQTLLPLFQQAGFFSVQINVMNETAAFGIEVFSV